MIHTCRNWDSHHKSKSDEVLISKDDTKVCQEVGSWNKNVFILQTNSFASSVPNDSKAEPQSCNHGKLVNSKVSEIDKNWIKLLEDNSSVKLFADLPQ